MCHDLEEMQSNGTAIVLKASNLAPLTVKTDQDGIYLNYCANLLLLTTRDIDRTN